MTVQTEKKDIRLVTPEALREFFVELGEKPFRAKQVDEWLWKKSATSFNAMTNLSLPIREKLKQHFEIRPITTADIQQSNDGTVKCAFRLFDNHIVEGVLIPASERMTACISSQVGCSLTCAFCATGTIARKRNIDHAEIYDQVVVIKNIAEEKYNKPLTNIVYMGMGEPLLNYRETLLSVEKITSPNGLGMSPKRITISTAGIAKMIKKLGDDEVKFNLALSLHAANDEKRSKIMPINDQNSLAVLKEALQHYFSKTGNRVTFEYIIFKDFNDGLKDAAELADFCKHVPSKVNIIEYNPIDNGNFEQAEVQKTDAFAASLENEDIIVNIRRSRGKDIDAACGQLANKNKAAVT